jgi:hypothetical protein
MFEDTKKEETANMNSRAKMRPPDPTHPSVRGNNRKSFPLLLAIFLQSIEALRSKFELN